MDFTEAQSMEKQRQKREAGKQIVRVVTSSIDQARRKDFELLRCLETACTIDATGNEYQKALRNEFVEQVVDELIKLILEYGREE